MPEEKNDRGPIDLLGEVVEDEYLYTDGKRCHVPWSEREKKALKQAVGLWGAKWETILQSKRFGHNFHAKRTGGYLRDAYRRLDGDRRKKKGNRGDWWFSAVALQLCHSFVVETINLDRTKTKN